MNSTTIRWFVLAITVILIPFATSAAYFAGDNDSCGWFPRPEGMPTDRPFSAASPILSDGSFLAAFGESTIFRWRPEHGWHEIKWCCANNLLDPVAITPDGGVILSRGFQSDATGALMQKFTASGVLDGNFTSPLGYGQVDALLVNAQGQLVIIGSFTNLNGIRRQHAARLMPDGGVDLTFDVGQAIPTRPSGSRYRAGFQQDGSLIVAGTRIQSAVFVASLPLLRFQTNGESDPSFQPGVEVPNGFDTRLLAMVISPDDKIILFGSFATPEGERADLVRLLKDGAFDPTFRSRRLLEAESPEISSLVVDRSGRLTISSWFSQVDHQPVNDQFRLLPDGTLDPAFRSPSPFLPFLLGPLASLGNEKALRADGTLVHWEASTLVPPSIRLSRYYGVRTIQVNEGDGVELQTGINGNPAPSLMWLRNDSGIPGATNAWVAWQGSRMGHSGVYTLIASNQAGVATQIVASVAVRRVPQTAGNPDREIPSWIPTSRGDRDYHWGAPQVDAQDRVVIGSRGSRNWELVRILPNGQKDPSFLVRPNKQFNGVGAVLPLPDDRIIASLFGFGSPENLLVRYTRSGELDTSFRPPGIRLPTAIYVKSYLAYQNGTLYAVGWKTGSSDPTPHLVSINQDGSLDPGIDTPLPGFIDLRPSGHDGLWVMRRTSVIYPGTVIIERYDLTGRLDPSFRLDPEVSPLPFGLVTLSDGRIMVVNVSPGGWTLQRLSLNGSIDPSFQPVSFRQQPAQWIVDPKARVTIQLPPNSGMPPLMRYLPNGTIDPTFDYSPWIPTPSTKLAMRSDSRIVTWLNDSKDNSSGIRLIQLRAEAEPLRPPTVAAPLSPAKPPRGFNSLLAAGLDGEQLKYQWVLNGRTVGTNEILEIEAARGLTSGTYSVIGWNSLERITNGPIVFGPAVESTPLQFPAKAHASLSIYEGGSVRLNAGPAPSTDARYQWFHDGVEISGATLDTLFVENVQRTDEGCYQVQVSNHAGLMYEATWSVTTLEPTIRLFNISRSIRGGARFTAVAAPGTQIIVEWSKDMQRWQQLFKTTAVVQGNIIEDLVHRGLEPKFYRVRVEF